MIKYMGVNRKRDQSRVLVSERNERKVKIFDLLAHTVLNQLTPFLVLKKLILFRFLPFSFFRSYYLFYVAILTKQKLFFYCYSQPFLELETGELYRFIQVSSILPWC